jgi:hypothetical protein
MLTSSTLAFKLEPIYGSNGARSRDWERAGFRSLSYGKGASVKSAFLGTSLVALLLVPGAPVRADVIFNNFGVGNSYNTSVAWIIGQFPGTGITWEQGDSFHVSGGTFRLSTIDLALNLLIGPNAVDVHLRADDNGRPGAVLESFHLTDLLPLGLPNPPVVATSLLHPLLENNATYWLTASASALTDVGWNLNSTGDIGAHALSQNGAPFTVINDVHGAFRVNGDLVPEPGTLALWGFGVFGLVCCRRWVARTARGPE